MSGSLDGKVAIVTGAGRGIGQAFAIGLAQAGARVAAVDLAPATDTVAQIKAAGGQAIAPVCDVTDESAVQAMVEQVRRELGRVDVLVNNAGAYPFGPIEACDRPFLERLFALNVYGVFHCTRAVVPLMKAQGSGKIINISSSTFHVGVPMASAYVATKGAVVGMARALARELGPYNIQINAITPGLTQTPGVKESEGITDALYDELVKAQCIPRRENPQDMVGGVVFLAGPGSDFMTGQILNIDGGFGLH
jgi:NAD(P)-dependent dehydrogenase (short-subunit alcohol dehydrogenase family)